VSASPVSEPFIRVRDLRFRYAGATHDALSMPSFEVDRPGLVAITGPSGAGKSTLMELLAGTLNQHYSGSVQVLGAEWSELRGDRARQFHLRRIGLIPQDLGLLPSQTPRQMLHQALIDAGVPRAQCEDRIVRALTQVEMVPFADRRIAELSGGQKQRVAIARALVRNVELILADEPTANLHVELADETLSVLRRIAATVPVVMVTHDPRMAAQCDRQLRVAAPSGSAPVTASALASPVAPVVVAAAGVASAASALPALIPIPGFPSAPVTASSASASTFSRPVPVSSAPAPAFSPPAVPKAAASPTAATSRVLRASADPPPRVWPAPAGARSTDSVAPTSAGLRSTGSLAAGSSAAPLSSAFSRLAASRLPASRPAPASSRVTSGSASGSGLASGSGSASGDDGNASPVRKPTVLMAAACACGVAAVLGVLFAGPLASHPASTNQPAASAVPPVTATPTPGTTSAPAVQANPAPAASPAAPAITTPVTATKPVTHSTTVSRTTTKPSTAPSTPAPAPSPAAQQATIIATSTPNTTPTPTAAAATNPYQSWINFMQAFSGSKYPTATPTP